MENIKGYLARMFIKNIKVYLSRMYGQAIVRHAYWNSQGYWWFTVPPKELENEYIYLLLIDQRKTVVLVARIKCDDIKRHIKPLGKGAKNAGRYHIRIFLKNGFYHITSTTDGETMITVDIIERIDLSDNLLNEDGYEDGYEEGEERTSMHNTVRRNSKLVRDAKEKFRKEHDGQIYCEICGANLENVYGVDCTEVHHENAVSQMKPGETTSLDSIKILCPNCHRVIHSRYPHLSLNDVRKLLNLMP